MIKMSRLTINMTPMTVFVVASPVIVAMSVGGLLGYPNVLIQQLQRNDTTITLDLDSSSWIGSIHGLAGIPTILMPSLMQWKGRKVAFLISCNFVMIGWLLAYLASSLTTILISESFHGLGCNSILTVSTCSVSEMTDPSYRSVFGVSYFILLATGLTVVEILGQFVHWKTVALIMLIPNILAFLNVCFVWPESPSWLALKKRYEECERSFKWLRGDTDKAKSELNELLQAHKVENQTQPLCERLCRRDFYIPAILMFFIMNLSYWSGVNVVIIYFGHMVKMTSGSDSAASKGTIIMSLVLLISTIICAFLVKKYENKSILLFSATMTMLMALFCCVVAYLQSVGYMANSLVFSYGLIMYIATSALGVTTIVYNISMEIMPVKHRGIGGALYAIYSCFLHSTSLKAAPYMFVYLNLWGTFLVYTINAIISIMILWKFVPETKSRTLQELEDYFAYGKFVKRAKNEDVYTAMVQT